MGVSLVPVRKRRRLDNRVRLEQGEPYGREKMLRSLGQACGCQNTPCCDDCSRIMEWVKRYVSREALKIEGNTMKIKGMNTRRLLYINDKRVELKELDDANWMGSILLSAGNLVSFREPNGQADDALEFEVIEDESPNADHIPEPDMVEEETPDKDERMVERFRRYELTQDAGTMNQTQASTPQDRQTKCTSVLNTAVTCAEDPVKSQGPVCEQRVEGDDVAVGLSQADSITLLKITATSDEERAHVLSSNDLVASTSIQRETLSPQQTPETPPHVAATRLSQNAWNTPRLLARLEKDIEQDALAWEKANCTVCEGGEEKRADLSGSMEKKHAHAHFVATAKVTRMSPKVLDLTTAQNTSIPAARVVRPLERAMSEDTNISIMFVQLGRELTAGRIRTLSNVVKRKGAIVVTKLESNPTYLVVPANIGVDMLATNLGFKSSKKVQRLVDVVDQRGITPVKPAWITNNKGKKLKSPKLMELYNGLVQRQPKKQRPALAVSVGSPSEDSGGKFVSEVPSTGGPVSRNVEIADLFRHLAKLYQKAQVEALDEFRAYTFNLIAGRLSLLDFEIATDPMAVSKLREVRGIGPSSLDFIKEWIRTGKIQRIHSLETEEQRVSIANLIRIWGVGPKMAKHLYSNGFDTIEKVRRGLRHDKIELKPNQLIGVECYEDFQLKMSREEVEQICDIIRKALLVNFPDATIQIMGSYRRGKKECGDGDFLITEPSFVNGTPRLALGEMVRQLSDNGHISHHLTHIPGIERCDSQSSEEKTHPRKYDLYRSAQSYMGVFNSPVMKGVRRRVDIKFYPYRERIFASLYFTGCGWFNRSMRLWSFRKKQLTLNDHGLFPKSGQGTHHVPGPAESLLFNPTTEVQVFDRLGLVYKQPHERNCFDDVVSKEGLTVASLDISNTTLRHESERNQNESIGFFDD